MSVVDECYELAKLYALRGSDLSPEYFSKCLENESYRSALKKITSRPSARGFVCTCKHGSCRRHSKTLSRDEIEQYESDSHFRDRYDAMYGSESLRMIQRAKNPCIHRGETIHRTSCSCAVYTCKIHKECTRIITDEYKSCTNCEDYTPSNPKVLFKLDRLLAPGDTIALTGAIHAFHKRYPDYVIDIECVGREFFNNTPYIQPIPKDDPQLIVKTIDQSLINDCNDKPIHMIEAYYYSICKVMSVPYEFPELKGHIPLTDEEKQRVVEEPYIVINAGWKNDNTTKAWPTKYYQSVVDEVRSRISFVQVGENNPEWHNHPRLNGVIDMVGKTGPPNSRRLASLIYNAELVISPLSLPMHLAGAYGIPAIILAGGREPISWSQYPNHQMMHTIGWLDCCKQPCWKSRTVPLADNEGFDNSLCEKPEGSFPKCMWMITPDQVISLVRSILR